MAISILDLESTAKNKSYSEFALQLASYSSENKKNFNDNSSAQLYNNLRKGEPTGSGGDTGSRNVVGKTVNSVGSVLNSATSHGEKNLGNEFISPGNFTQFLFDSGGNFKGIAGMLGEIANTGLQAINMQLNQQFTLQKEINEKTTLMGKLSESFRESITDAYPETIRLGISFEELQGTMSKILTDSGRFKVMSKETIESIALNSKVYFNSMEEAAGAVMEFQKVSRGAKDAMDAAAKAGKASMELGINAKETVNTLTKNIEKLNQFGFRNGIDGLTKMVQQAQVLKFDLEATFKLADEVMDPAKAIEMSANLAIVGGAFGDLADPLKMMYDATNDVGALQESLKSSVESLVTFDQKSQTFGIFGANLRKARGMADALGMSLKDVSNLAVQAAQRTEAMSSLRASGMAFSDDEREFITNLAQMKNGKMVVELKTEELEKAFGTNEIVLSKMTTDQRNLLTNMRGDIVKANTQNIAEQQVGILENMERNLSYLAAYARTSLGAKGAELSKVLGYDPVEVVKETRAVTEYLKTHLGSTLDAASKALGFERVGDKLTGNKITPTGTASNKINTTEPTNKGTETKSTTPTETKHIVESNINIRSENIFDTFNRELIKNAEVSQTLKKSYLAAFPK
jgi:hypothetical protein